MVAPEDGETGVSTSPTLEVTVSDPDSDPLDVTFYGRGGSGEEFTIIALPDTQKYVLNGAYPQIFTCQTQWIKDSVALQSIVFVTQEGDIVDTWNNETEWSLANNSMSVLETGDGGFYVRYGVLPGNHDMSSTGDATYYNQTFPYTRYQNQPWYGGHYPEAGNENNYQLFSAGGEDYIIVHLQYAPTSAVFSWANSVLAGNSDRKAIITTHDYMETSGARSTNGTNIWNNVVVPNSNVYFVLCGHNHDEATRSDWVGDRQVHQLLADYQDRASGGDGWLRIMRFVPAEDKVYVQTYSPYLEQYETDANSQFTLNFPMGGFSEIGSVAGVPSGSSASIVWPGLSPLTVHEWYVSVADSTGKTGVGPVWQFTTESNDTAPPAISGVEALDITDTGARIVWTTDEVADSLVDYGPDAGYGSQASDLTLVTSHSIALTSLDPNTFYHYRVSSKDSAGNIAYGDDCTFTTLPVNHPPVAYDQSVNTGEDTQVAITLAASDEDNDPLTYSLVSLPANGTLTGTPPDVAYTPNSNYSGDDSFTFKATDGKADSNVATVSITVTPVNDPPAAPANLTATAGVGKVTLDWADGTDPEGDLQGYNVYRSTAEGGPYDKINGAVVATSAYVDAAVVNGTAYYYVVTAVDSSSESSHSNEASATPYAQQAVHVQDITMTLQKTGKTSYKASATVLIHDQNSTPRSGARVVGDWYLKGTRIKTGASGRTNSTGKVTITSPQKTAKTGDTFTFKVTNVTLSGYPYAPEQNVETEDSISVP